MTQAGLRHAHGAVTSEVDAAFRMPTLFSRGGLCHFTKGNFHIMGADSQARSPTPPTPL